MNDCDLYRADIDAYRDDMLDKKRHEQVSIHIESCRDCTQEIRMRERLDLEIRAAAAHCQVPAGLWIRVRTSVKSLQAQSKQLRPINHKPATWVPVAMLIVAVVVGSLFFTRSDIQSSSESVAMVLVNEFHTFVVSQRQLDFTDSQPMAVRQWFGDKVEFRVPVPIETGGLKLTGGRLCNMLEQRVASYMYQSDGAWVSLYIMKSKSGLDEGISDEVMLRGYGFLEWENDGLHYSLIGDISIDRLRLIAKTIYQRQLSPQPLQSNLLQNYFSHSDLLKA